MKRFQTAVAVGAFLMASAGAYAVVNTWNGSQSTQWQDASNWDGLGLPDNSNDTANIDDSNSPGSTWPILDQDRTIGDLQMADGTSGTPVSLDTSGYTLTVTDTGTGNGQFLVDDTVGGSGSYVELRNDTGSASDPGVINAKSIVIRGSASNAVTLVVVPGANSTTTFQTN